MQLPVGASSLLQPVIGVLVKDISPVAMICFGYSSSVVSHESCFQHHKSESHHFDILIVQSNVSHRKDHEIIDLAKSRFPCQLSINVLSHSENSVKNALREKHPFFCKVFNEGSILYQAENGHFDDELNPSNPETPKPLLVDDIKRSFDLADNFLSMASDAIGNDIHDGGVFLLHQAMEQMCIASIKAHLKYRPTTHSILKLIALVNCYAPQAKGNFPCNTNEELELFNFLRKAYSDVRYKSSYRIPPHISFSLLERVQEFSHLLIEKYKQEFGKREDEALE